jgi:hypothetical protein
MRWVESSMRFKPYVFSGISLMGYLRSHDLNFCQLVQFQGSDVTPLTIKLVVGRGNLQPTRFP